jgi:RecB family exonuclease
MSNNLIDYWSYSSMASLLSNPMAFKKQYILKQYDDLTSPSALVGSACHKALEMFFKGLDQDAAISEGLKVINEKSDIGINYGKTGTRAAILATYTKAINYAFAELPTFHELLGVEESITIEIDSMTGGTMALPAKAKMDIVERNKLGELEITDWKFVKSYTNADVDDFKKWLQGMFNYYVIKAKYGEAPARIRYRECKVTGNKDNTPQMQAYTYEFNSPADFATFEKLYNECTTQISLPGYQFLPNPNDIFDGQITFEIYRQGIMGVEAPVAVPHKTEQVAFADKQFVPSAGDRVENKDLSMEERIRLKMQEFVGAVEMQETHVGPSVTQYTLKVSRGIPMSKIARMDRDIALAIEARSLRVEAPIPGTGLVGIEVPSAVRKTVELTDNHLRPGTLQLPIGVNVFNEVIYKDLGDMPHLLVAGATGAGKSVMLNVIIQALTKQLTPDALQLVLVDPKQVEFAPFESLPHLALPVVYDNKGAANVLAATVEEMEKRYKMLRRRNCRSIQEFNAKGKPMPYRVLILDEFADLMMTAEKQPVGNIDIKQFNENLLFHIANGNGKLTQKATKAALADTLDDGIAPAEQSIIRLAQKARAVGIHLILATQRPSADVVTGLIKANIPTKIAFMTTSKVNSQIVIDQSGAEELTGKGDMLFLDPTKAGLTRLQGLYC